MRLAKEQWRGNSIKVSVDSSTEEIQPHDARIAACTVTFALRDEKVTKII